MPWLGRGQDRPSEVEEREQELSREQIEAGGLPVTAERRLRELAAEGGALFTSDLSVNEFALLRHRGIEPITQVLGSSIFQHGWQGLPYDTWYGYSGGGRSMFGGAGALGSRNWGSSGDGSAWTRELTYLSDAYNQSRERALGRLSREATLAGADAVVGVRIGRTGREFAGGDTVEFSAVGTAVRLPAELRAGHVVVTSLSGQEYVQLAAAGCRPVGVVGVSTVMYVASSFDQSWILSSGNSFFSVAGRANQELPDFTRGFYEAREVAMWHLNGQAASVHAAGIVGMQVEQQVREREYEDANHNTHHDLMVFIHLLGTAITDGHPPLAEPALTTVLPLQRPRTPTPQP